MAELTYRENGDYQIPELVLDGEEFSNLAGKELDFSAICSEQGGDTPDVEASYAHCDIRIAFP